MAGVMRKIKLGSQGLEVSAQGLGCMRMSTYYGPPKPEGNMIALIRHAVDSGVTFLDTSDLYGPYTNEILLGKALKGGIRGRVQLATKFGIGYADGKRAIRWDPAYVRAACEASLKRLDVDCIDLYYQHRIDATVPIEITKSSCCSPNNNDTVEWSLWTRDVEGEIVPTCRELGIGIVAYSPLGRGFLSSGPKLVENFSEDGIRKHYFPRFQPENVEHNKQLFDRINEIAAKKGCTPSQLALAWVHHQGDDVCPIPGTTKVDNFNQNIKALSVKLTPEDMAELESIAWADSVKGDRYGSVGPTYKESETPPLSLWKVA